MNRLKLFSRALAGALALAMSTSASAAELLFEWDAPGSGRDFRFTLDSDPDPAFSLNGNFFRIDNVLDLISRETLASIFVLHNQMGGGIVIQPGDIAAVWASGETLYRGPLTRPSFRTGTFALQPGTSGFTGGTLTISPVTVGPQDGLPTTTDPGDIVVPMPAVPEPSTWLLFLLGFLAIGVQLRHRSLSSARA